MRGKPTAWLRAAALALAGCLAALLLFDVLAYFFAPASMTAFAPHYRAGPHRDAGMRGYHRKDPVMGFDIAPNRRGHRLQIIGAGTVPASSNDLGCRDPRDLADIRALDSYVYFAGDSFTWGFVPPNHTIPHLYEAASGNPSLNCGVTNTGQWHQLEKFRRTAAAIGRHPFRVVLVHYANDIGDDLTQTPGKVQTGHAKPVPQHQTADLPQAGRQEEEKRQPNHSQRPLQQIHLFFIRSSLSYLMVRAAMEPWRRPRSSPILAQRVMEIENYLHNPYTRPNREAFQAWARHSHEHGYELVVVLIPHKKLLNTRPSREWRKGVKSFLDSLGIRHLDFAHHVESTGASLANLYWPHDLHLDEGGNQVLAALLARDLP